jgi:hypothetical protein
MTTLQETREIEGAVLVDEDNRHYAVDECGNRFYGYFTHLTGAYVCYTCGHLCDCGEGEE